MSEPTPPDDLPGADDWPEETLNAAAPEFVDAPTDAPATAAAEVAESRDEDSLATAREVAAARWYTVFFLLAIGVLTLAALGIVGMFVFNQLAEIWK